MIGYNFGEDSLYDTMFVSPCRFCTAKELVLCLVSNVSRNYLHAVIGNYKL